MNGLLGLCVFVFLLAPAHADLIVLKDGRRFEGTVLKQDDRQVVFETRFGKMTFKRSEVSKIEEGLTPTQEFDQRYKSCKGAEDFFALGKWAQSKKLSSLARKAFKKAVRLEPAHEGANRGLGHVLHEGRWVKPDERARLIKQAADQDMRERGLVEHEGRWVTLAEKAHLDAGETFHEGRWLKPGELERARGLEQLDGEWVPAPVARSVLNARAILAPLPGEHNVAQGEGVLVAGPFDSSFLREIVSGLERGGAWMSKLMRLPEGEQPRKPHAKRVPALHEFYVFGQDSEPYTLSVDPLVALTDTVPPGFGESVKDTHGFYLCEPRGLSSARCMGRPQAHLKGHCFHHRGHILINQHHYDGRLLPPWFDEGFACLFEFRVHQQNQVVCVAGLTHEGVQSGTNARGREVYVFNAKEFRTGAWEGNLRSALAAKDAVLVNFDTLAQKRFGELEPVHVAMSMAIVAWIEQHGEGSLRRFQESLKASAPRAPQRVIVKSSTRQARYNKAFQASVGMDWRVADKEWRQWFLETH